MKLRAVFPLLLLVAACSQSKVAASSSAPTDGSAPLDPGNDSAQADGAQADGATPAVACTLLAAGKGDSTAIGSAPSEYSAILRATQPDANGFLGLNHTDGEMVSARFQEGAGLAVRIAVVQNDAAAAANELRGIEAGMATVDSSTGELVTLVPPDAGIDGGFNIQTQADAAAFFLGDACLGILAALTTPASWNIASRAEALIKPAGLGIEWLRGLEAGQHVIATADASAPNRLLFAARAFAACGALAHDSAASAQAQPLILQAQALQDGHGVFQENGGSDTNYQSFSVRNGYDLLTVSGQATCDDFFPNVLAGARWLAGRVQANGTVDSSGNTRTCGGCEVFLPGELKVLSIPGLFEALAAVGAIAPDADVFSAGKRAADFFIANPTTNTCMCTVGSCACDGGM